MRALELSRMRVNTNTFRRIMSDGRVQEGGYSPYSSKTKWNTVGRAHFIEKSGLSGYMPDHIDVSDSWDSCVESLTQLFDLSERRARELRRNGYIDLDNAKHGAEYANIDICSCDDPLSHSEEREEWGKDEWRELGYYTGPRPEACTNCGAPLGGDDYVLCEECVDGSSRAADAEMYGTGEGLS